MNTILALLAGVAVPFIAKRLVSLVKGEVPKAAESLKNGLNSIDGMIERKTGIDIPDSWQKRLHDWITYGVDKGVKIAEVYVYNPKFWTKVFSFIATSGRSDWQTLYSTLADALSKIDWKGEIMSQLPSELVPIVNSVKEAEATKIAVGSIQSNIASGVVSKTIPESVPLKTAEEIRAAVAPIIKAASASVVLENGFVAEFSKTGMTPELAAKMSAAHAERMKALSAK